MKTYKFLFVYVLCIPFFLSGCSQQKKPSDLPPLVKSTLTLTQDGKPLSSATVILHAVDNGQTKWIPGGTSDESGKVTLRVSGLYEGAPVGKYIATVHKTMPEKSKFVEPKDTNSADYEKWRNDVENEKLPMHRYIDTKYENMQTSGLNIEILASGSKEIGLDVSPAIDVIVK